MKVSVEMTDNLARALRSSQARADDIMGAGLRDLGHEFVQAAQGIAKNGPYARSFRVDSTVSLGRRGLGLDAGSDSPMAALLERGRKPGRRPPPQSIRKRAGGSFEAAARSADRIERSGTKGRWTVKRANAQIKADGTFERVARRTLAAITDLGD